MISKISTLLLSLANLGLSYERRQLIRLATELPNVPKDWEEAAEEFGSEPISEDEYLDKVAPKPVLSSKLQGVKTARKQEDIVYDLLTKYNVRPVSAGQIDIIGAGCFGFVIRAVYSGKPVVAKIAIAEAGKVISRDVLNWKKILDIKRTMPDNLKKHIPEVYLVVEESFDNSGASILGQLFAMFRYKPGWSFQLIVMEELKPLAGDMAGVLSGYKISPSTINVRLDHLLSKINSLLVKFNLMPMTADDLHDTIKGIKLRDISRPGKAPTRAGQAVYVTTYDIVNVVMSHVILTNKLSDVEVARLKRYEFRVLLEDITKEVFDWDEISFPIDSKDSATHYQSEDTSGLLETVKYLRSNGINWGDLHANNVMLGQDGNIKITDVGHFEIK